MVTSWSWNGPIRVEYELSTSYELFRPGVNLTFRWVSQHIWSCPPAGLVGCPLPSDAQDLTEPHSCGSWVEEMEMAIAFALSSATWVAGSLRVIRHWSLKSTSWQLLNMGWSLPEREMSRLSFAELVSPRFGPTACQDVALRGHAGVGVVSLHGAPRSIPTFATPSFLEFCRLGRAMRVVLPLGNGGVAHFFVGL